jgi:hypothetical protein
MSWGRHNHTVNAKCFDDSYRLSTIEFNHIHNVGREDDTGLCDGGGLHLCCSNCTRSGWFHMNHNHVHHVSTFQHRGCGLCYDSGGSRIHRTNNVVHDVVQHTINWNGFGPKFTNDGHFLHQMEAHSLFENNVLIKVPPPPPQPPPPRLLALRRPCLPPDPLIPPASCRIARTASTIRAPTRTATRCRTFPTATSA